MDALYNPGVAQALAILEAGHYPESTNNKRAPVVSEKSVKWQAFLKTLDDEPNMIIRDLLCTQAFHVLRGSITRCYVDNDKNILPEIKQFYYDVVIGREGTSAAFDAANRIDQIRKPYEADLHDGLGSREDRVLGQAAEDTNTSVRNTRLRHYFVDKKNNKAQKTDQWKNWWE